MRVRRTIAAVTLGATVILTGALPALAAPGVPGADVNAALAAVRQATRQYHDEATAVAAGYAPTNDCVAIPGGGMGYHYVNFAALIDPTLDPAMPEVLLYADAGQGRRLVAVEWISLYAPDPALVPPAGTPLPSMFGHTFDGWMPGHFPGMPWHAELHAWLWSANPDGVFTPFNPTIGC